MACSSTGVLLARSLITFCPSFRFVQVCCLPLVTAANIAKYYIYTKHPLPMDMEFIVQDTYSLTRPQWKLATNLDEATKALQLAIAQDQKNAGLDKSAEQDDASSIASSDDDGIEGEGEADGDIAIPEAEGDGESVSGDEDETEVGSLSVVTYCDY